MRARNIKPGTFTNDLLAPADPLYTVIFAGLWCLADREGRLEDRPLQIHIKINPCRPQESTVLALDWLVLKQFAVRYEVAGKRYLQISEFLKHQQPHCKEAPSSIPPPTESTVCSSTVQAPCLTGADTVCAPLIPDSGFLIPDSGFLSAGEKPPGASTVLMGTRGTRQRKPKAKNLGTDDPWFIEFKIAYPDRAGSQEWAEGRRRANARIAEGYTTAQMIDGARRYAAFNDAIDRTGTQFVKTAAVFLGKPSEGELPYFLQPWNPPPTKAQVAQNQNLNASLKWLAGDAP